MAASTNSKLCLARCQDGQSFSDLVRTARKEHTGRSDGGPDVPVIEGFVQEACGRGKKDRLGVFLGKFGTGRLHSRRERIRTIFLRRRHRDDSEQRRTAEQRMHDVDA